MPGDMDVDVVRHLEIDHLGPEVRVAEDQVGRDDAGLHDLARAVEVGQEHVQRLDPLDQARLELRPFVPRDQARHDVEGDQPLGRILVAVDREGDADAAEQQVGLSPPRLEQFRRDVIEPARQPLVDRPRPAILLDISSKNRGESDTAGNSAETCCRQNKTRAINGPVKPAGHL